MGHTDPFLLGTLGHLVELPSPPHAGMGANYDRTAGMQRSLNGGTTIDVFGAHRVWEFPLRFKHGGDAHRLITRWIAPQAEQLRLVDPLTPNRLSMDASTAGGVSKSADRISGDGDLQRVRLGTLDRPTEVAAYIDGAYRGDYGLDGAELLLDVDSQVPVVEGETITFRAWVRSNTSVGLLLRWRFANGAETDTDDPVQAVDPVEWTQVQIVAAVPPDVVAVAPGLYVEESPSASRHVELTAPMLTADDDDAWSPGGGAPVVVLETFEHGYVQLGRREMTLTVREA